MLALKIIVCVLVISNGVLGRDTRRGNVRHRPADDEYKYNHPPAPENFEAIPVAVVYEDEFNRVDKSVKSTPKNNVEQVDKEPLKSDSSIKEDPNDFEVSSDKHIEKPTNVAHEEPKVTTYRPQKEQHIPVAVVYDQDPAYYQKPRPNRNRVTNKRRKNQRPVSDEKQTAFEDAGISGSYVNGHTGPITTTKQVENLNTRRKTQQPIPEEKQTTVEDNIRFSVGQRENAPTALTVDKTEEKLTAAQVDSPTSEQGNKYATTVSKIELPVGQTENALSAFVVDTIEEKQTTAQADASTSEQGNEYAMSVSETRKPEQLNAFRKIQRPVQGNRQKNYEDNIRSSAQRNENTPSIYSADKSAKLNSRTEDLSQSSNRGNPTRVREVIPIVQSENLVFSQSGNFQYSYEGGDGTKAFEKGELKTFDDENAGEAVSGGFSYTAKDGNEYSLSYTADENGYRPIGAHLPTPPPIPPAIARALAYLATKPTPEPVTESLVEYDQ